MQGRASRKKYHYIYKITRFDGKYYIGMHSTDDLDDGYFGSGKRLWNSINFHGQEKHRKEIVEFLPDRKALREREKELITEQMLQDPLCMNLRKGGDGDWSYVNASLPPEERAKISGMGGSASWENMRNDPEFAKEVLRKRSEGIKRAFKDPNCKIHTEKFRMSRANAFKGKKHSEETKQKIGVILSIRQSGEKNSQFGTCWIHNLELKQSKKIKKDDLQDWLDQDWLKGRKLNFDLNN